MSVSRIKRGDIVFVRSGSNAGRHGKVLGVDARTGRALVEGINLVKKTFRRSQQYPDGAILEKEAPVALSNLMPYDEPAKRGARIRRQREDGKGVRVAKGSGRLLA